MRKNNTKTRKVIGMPFKKAAEYLLPVDDDTNGTPYGAKRLRAPISKNEFVGTSGSKIAAYVIDIDGTLQTWGAGASKTALEWCEKIYAADKESVFVIVTARTHDYDYERSFNWLMQNFPYPFIGPFCRVGDDPRYASEFKRELSQGFEDMGLYQIMGAADDNEFVIKMWKYWATEHFENPEDFNLLECGYGSYGGWRSDLSRKGTPYAYSGYTPYSAYDAYEGTPAVPAMASHRKAGYSRYDEDIPSFSEPVDLDRKERIESRLDLEDDVYAEYPDLTYAEIEAMDVEVLRQMALDADQPETGPLDVEEILDELRKDAPDGGAEAGAA